MDNLNTSEFYRNNGRRASLQPTPQSATMTIPMRASPRLSTIVTTSKKLSSMQAYDFGASKNADDTQSYRFRRIRNKLKSTQILSQPMTNQSESIPLNTETATFDLEPSTVDASIIKSAQAIRKQAKKYHSADFVNDTNKYRGYHGTSYNDGTMSIFRAKHDQKPLSQYKYLPSKHEYYCQMMNLKPLSESTRLGHTTRSLDPSVSNFIDLLESTKEFRKQMEYEEAKEHYQFLPTVSGFKRNVRAVVFIGKLKALVKGQNSSMNVDYQYLRRQQRNIQYTVDVMQKNKCQTYEDLVKCVANKFDEKKLSEIVTAILKDAPASRTEKQKKILKLWLQSQFIPKTKALKDITMSDDDLELLAYKLKLVTLETNELLFRQGDVATAFYMILTGSVGVWIESQEAIESNISSQSKTLDRFKYYDSKKIKKSNSSYVAKSKPAFTKKKNKKSSENSGAAANKVASLPAGVSFGELGLLATNKKDQIRKATIIAQVATDLIVMDSETFKRIVKFDASNSNKSFIAKTKFFKTIPLWSSLPKETMTQLCIVTEKKTFEKNEMIVPFFDWQNENEPQNSEIIYWIEDGCVDFVVPRCMSRSLKHTTIENDNNSKDIKHLSNENMNANYNENNASDNDKSSQINWDIAINKYNNMINTVNVWNPKIIEMNCESVMQSSGSQLLGIDRTLLYLNKQMKKLKPKQELLNLPLGVVAKSKCTVHKMYFKNFLQFIFKSETSLSEYFNQLCFQKQMIYNQWLMKHKTQMNSSHISHSYRIPSNKKNKRNRLNNRQLLLRHKIDAMHRQQMRQNMSLVSQ